MMSEYEKRVFEQLIVQENQENLYEATLYCKDSKGEHWELKQCGDSPEEATKKVMEWFTCNHEELWDEIGRIYVLGFEDVHWESESEPPIRNDKEKLPIDTWIVIDELKYSPEEIEILIHAWDVNETESYINYTATERSGTWFELHGDLYGDAKGLRDQGLILLYRDPEFSWLYGLSEKGWGMVKELVEQQGVMNTLCNYRKYSPESVGDIYFCEDGIRYGDFCEDTSTDNFVCKWRNEVWKRDKVLEMIGR